MPRHHLQVNTFDAALDRMITLYENHDNRIIVSFSAGKDSTCCLEICRMARQITDHPEPVDVMIRDEEIMFPGTYEYAERIAKEPDVRMWWLVSNQPIVNVYNRREPYFWVFDPELEPSSWVREPPDFFKQIPTMAIEYLVTLDRFPVWGDTGRLFNVIGLRASESSRRAMGIQSAMSYYYGPLKTGAWPTRPIYDWVDGDVWLAIQRNNWDYNRAYDVMHKMGLPRSLLRIAPPTMTVAGTESLMLAAKAWPGWFERVAERCPGVRQAALFGRRAVTPQRRAGETWEEAFQRICIDDAPYWISARARKVQARMRSAHAHHSEKPLPEEVPCFICGGQGGWAQLTHSMYNGDPFSLKLTGILPYVEPEFFRPGGGTWGGKPNW